MFCDRQGGDSDGMVVELTSVYVYIHVHVYTLPVLITTDRDFNSYNQGQSYSV